MVHLLFPVALSMMARLLRDTGLNQFFLGRWLTPFLKGSVFDCFIRTEIIPGLDPLSVARLANVECCLSSNSSCSGAVSSPDLRNQKIPHSKLPIT